MPPAQTPSEVNAQVVEKAKRYDLLISLTNSHGTLAQYPRVLESVELLDGWDNIKKQFMSVNDGAICDARMLSVLPLPCGFQSFLQDLFRGTVNLPRHSPDWIIQLKDRITRNVLRAFAVDCLCEQVFHSDFPDFDMANGLVLEKYREQFKLTDSLKVLRIWDAMITEELIATKRFQDDVLPAKVDEWSAKMHESLLPFFPEAGALPEGEPITHDRSKRYLNCVRDAWNMKHKLMLSSPMYELRRFQAGVLYDPKEMEAVDLKGNPREHVSAGVKIRVCVFPALMQFDQPNFAVEDSFRAALVSSRRFYADDKVVKANLCCVGRATVEVDD
ncbi:hypothetical protein BDV96DRAFT_576632 [Lophiotrema nucula]|uniref:Uncharacterized protein n=1 Tax=Lophiotrema nucula TaxID=690887 RepID=A0A6A5Z7I8_9PLEO|nr:hypothetical protein BDV96DRAFT_576632 [Lophiotrema nucula]